MAEERKRKPRTRKTTNGGSNASRANQARNSGAAANTNASANSDDQQMGQAIVNDENSLLAETTLGEESWQQEATPEDVLPDDADILVAEVIPLNTQGSDDATNALIDPDAPDLTPPNEVITPQETARDRARGQQVLADLDELDREAADLAAAEATPPSGNFTNVAGPAAEFDNAATEGTAPAQSFVAPDDLDGDTATMTAGLAAVALPMTTGADTVPMPMTQGQPTEAMPMMQRAGGARTGRGNRARTARASSPAGDTTQGTPNTATPSQPQPAASTHSRQGLPFDDRWLSIIGGGALAVTGALRRGWPGAVMGLVGAGLVARGIVQTVRGRSAYRALTVEHAITINRTPKELYRFWRNFENLPRFMQHLEAVTVLDEQRSHWKAKAPANTAVEWDAVITADEPNARIAWESTKDAQVANAGFVTFTPAPGGRGTEVRVRLRYLPPAGKLGAAVAALLGQNPDQQVHEDLRHLKEMIETGEIPTTDGQPAGGKRARR